MLNPQDLVTEFHHAFGLPVGDRPVAEVTGALTDLRLNLLRDEVQELADAVATGNVADIAQEMADVVYVVYGYAVTNGIRLDQVVAAVHEANMSKLGPDGQPILREDGKVLKGPNFRPPDVAGVLGIGEPPTLQELLERHDWDELILGGFICLHCTPEGCDDPDDNVYWPCPPLRDAGMTDEKATAVVAAHYAAVSAKAKADRAALQATRQDVKIDG